MSVNKKQIEFAVKIVKTLFPMTTIDHEKATNFINVIESLSTEKIDIDLINSQDISNQNCIQYTQILMCIFEMYDLEILFLYTETINRNLIIKESQLYFIINAITSAYTSNL